MTRTIRPNFDHHRSTSTPSVLHVTRYVFDTMSTGHRLHTEDSCLAGCGDACRDALAHNIIVPHFREWMGRATCCECRGMSVGNFVGFDSVLEPSAQASVDGARRVGFATLAYHRIRALWHATGSRRESIIPGTVWCRQARLWLQNWHARAALCSAVASDEHAFALNPFVNMFGLGPNVGERGGGLAAGVCIIGRIGGAGGQRPEGGSLGRLCRHRRLGFGVRRKSMPQARNFVRAPKWERPPQTGFLVVFMGAKFGTGQPSALSAQCRFQT